MTLNELFKNTTYDDTLFSDEAKSAVSARIFMKAVRGSKVPYITCAIRDKEIKLTPEEAVRQLYIYKLMNEYGYAASRIQLETPIHFGREVKRADIAIMDKNRPMVPYIIVELKKPKLTDGKEQLKSYCNATGASIGVWTNGEQISCYNRKDPNFFEEISDIPKATQKLSDIINEKFTYEDLKRKDKISTQKKSLRSLIKEMEDEVLASAGVDSFEEIFKLIFAKLYDELICANDPTAYLQFRNNGNTDYELKEKIQGLFDDAKKKWEGIFTDESKILLSPSHLAVCVASLQDIAFLSFHSNHKRLHKRAMDTGKTFTEVSNDFRSGVEQCSTPYFCQDLPSQSMTNLFQNMVWLPDEGSMRNSKLSEYIHNPHILRCCNQ